MTHFNKSVQHLFYCSIFVHQLRIRCRDFAFAARHDIEVMSLVVRRVRVVDEVARLLDVGCDHAFQHQRLLPIQEDVLPCPPSDEPWLLPQPLVARNAWSNPAWRTTRSLELRRPTHTTHRPSAVERIAKMPLLNFFACPGYDCSR